MKTPKVKICDEVETGMKTPKVKICGLTKPEEAIYLNKIKVDYAGFVFANKSKRFVSLEQAVQIKKQLSSDIKTVAVTVSPSLELLNKIINTGFDRIQVHGTLQIELLNQIQIPVWRACNLEDIKELEHLEDHKAIEAYVVDAQQAGSGKTFHWQESVTFFRERRETCFYGKSFILAGGLHAGNVEEGISLMRPDIVDVSSGVEEEHGKSESLIIEFVEKVRKNEKIG